MYECLPECIHVLSAQKSQKRASDPLKLELQVAVGTNKWPLPTEMGGGGKKKETGLLIQKFYFWNSFQIWIVPGIQTLDTLPSSAVVALKKGKDKRNDKLRDRVQNEVCVCGG